MKEITLTQGKIVQVDDEDYLFLLQFHWHAVKAKTTYYALAWIPKEKRNLSMGQVLLNPKLGERVDHRDSNGLNNQRYNIRLCSIHQNSMNQSKQKIENLNIRVFIREVVELSGK